MFIMQNNVHYVKKIILRSAQRPAGGRDSRDDLA
jgi:hypothetical protein